MTALNVSGEHDLRCSVQTAALGEHPAGSAGYAHRVLLVELPLPWPKKIDQHELLADLTISDEFTKLLGIRSSETTQLDRHRVICWERTQPFRGYDRTETVVETNALAPLLHALARSGPQAIEEPAEIDPNTHDLLICTHGTRDRCCGQLGTRLHAEVSPTMPAHVRTWRTSHTGGHRFAPTAIHFPHGTTWSTLTPELLNGIIDQSTPTLDTEPHYRGNLGIQGRPAQIAEGATFLARGWEWLTNTRSVTTTVDADTVTALVSFEGHVTTVTMREHDAIAVPACGDDISASTKATPQFRVIG